MAAGLALVFEHEGSDGNALLQTLPYETTESIRCPHCGNDVRIVDVVPIEVVCESCGSSFDMDPGATRVHERIERTLGAFQLTEEIGRGSFGVVYKATDTKLRRVVAVKVPRTGTFSSQKDQQRFLREARHAGSLQHHGIVRIHEVGTDASQCYIVSEFIEGLTLEDELSAGRISFRDAASVLVKVAEAVEYAHTKRVIHRDLKPSNILLNTEGQPFVADFGLAKRQGPAITMTRDGEIIGTPAYMSPEQAAAENSDVGPQSDVYSLGVILYRMLSGELPFRGSKRMLLHQVMNEDPAPPRQLNENVPRDLQTIALKAMEKVPEARYQTAADFGAELTRFLAGDPIKARPPGATERVWKWCKKRPVISSLIGSIIALCLLIAVGSVLWTIQANRLTSQLDESFRAAQERLIDNLRQRYLVEVNTNGPLANLPYAVETLDVEGQLPDRRSTSTRRWIGASLRRTAKLTEVIPRNERIDSLVVDPKSKSLFVASGTDIARISTDTWQVLQTLPVGSRVSELHTTEDGQRLFAKPHSEGNSGVSATPNIAEREIATLWNIDTGQIVSSLQHTTLISSACFSSDSQWLATCTLEDVSIWNATTGNLIHRFDCRLANSCQFSNDGKLLFVQGKSEGGWKLQAWQTDDWQLDYSIDHGALIHDYSQTDTKLMTAGRQGGIRQWNLTDGTPEAIAKIQLSTAAKQVEPVGTTHILTRSENGEISFWNHSTGQIVWGPLGTEAHARFTASQNGTVFAVPDSAGMIDVFWMDAESVCNPLPVGGLLATHAGTPDGRFLITGTTDGVVKVWDLAGVANPGVALRTDSSAFDFADIRPVADDGVVVCPGNGEVLLVHAQNAVQKKIEPNPNVIHFDISPRLNLLAAGDVEGGVGVWDIATLQKSTTFENEWGNVNCVQFSPTDEGVFATGHSKAVVIWSVESTQPTAVWKFDSACREIRFDPTGKRLAVALVNKSVSVWDVAEDKKLTSDLLHRDGKFTSLVFSSDGGRLASSCLPWNTVWDWQSGKLLHENRKPMRVNSLLFVDGDNDFVGVDADGQVYRRSLSSGVEKWTVEATEVHQLRLNSNQVDLLVVDNNGARVLNVESGLLEVPPINAGLKTVAAFTSDDNHIATFSNDGFVRFWDTTPTDLNIGSLRDQVGVVTSTRYRDGKLVTLNPEELVEMFKRVKTQNPDATTASATDLAGWETRKQLHDITRDPEQP